MWTRYELLCSYQIDFAARIFREKYLLSTQIHIMEYRTTFKPANLRFWVFWPKTQLFITVCHFPIRVPPSPIWVHEMEGRGVFTPSYITGQVLFWQTQVSGSFDVRPNYIWQWALDDSSATLPSLALLFSRHIAVGVFGHRWQLLLLNLL